MLKTPVEGVTRQEEKAESKEVKSEGQYFCEWFFICKTSIFASNLENQWLILYKWTKCLMNDFDSYNLMSAVDCLKLLLMCYVVLYEKLISW